MVKAKKPEVVVEQQASFAVGQRVLFRGHEMVVRAVRSDGWLELAQPPVRFVTCTADEVSAV